MLTNQNEKGTGKFKLGARSRTNMVGLHPDLIRVIELAITITTVDFTIIEGRRTMDRQRELLRDKKTTTLNSRHLNGCAIDIVALKDGKVEWNDISLYHRISDAFKMAAGELIAPITWGGDWKTFKDFGHYELSWKAYPDAG